MADSASDIAAEVHTQDHAKAAQDTLVAAITDKGLEPDMDIISKMTGKAAQYFAGLMAD